MNTFRVFYLKSEHIRESFLLGRGDNKVAPEKYEPVTTFPSKDVETVWREMNVVNGTDDERPLALRCRSMMVGDVVLNVTEMTAHLCAMCGFEDLPESVYKLFLTSHPYDK